MSSDIAVIQVVAASPKARSGKAWRVGRGPVGCGVVRRGKARMSSDIASIQVVDASPLARRGPVR